MTRPATVRVHPAHRAGIVTSATVALLLLAVTAQAAWLTTGTGTASGTAGTIAAPATVDAERQSPATTVTVTWSSVPQATAYVVHRHTSAGATTGGTPVCSTVAPTPTCQDTDAPSTASWYRVTATRDAWTSPPSTAADVPGAAPQLAFTSCPEIVGRNQTWVARVTRPASTGQPVDVALQVDGPGAITAGTPVVIPANGVQSGEFTYRQENNNGNSTTTVTATADGHASVSCTFDKR